MGPYESMGENMDALFPSTVPADSTVYLEMPGAGGGAYDPAVAATPLPAIPDVLDDPRVRAALDKIQTEIDTIGTDPTAGLFGIPWPLVAGGLLLVLLIRR